MIKKYFMALIPGILLCISLAGCTSMSIAPASAPESRKSAPAVSGKAEAISVKPGDDLQSAVDNCKSGQKIILKQGRYDIKGTISVKDKENIILEGEGEVWLDTKGIDHQVLTFKGCRGIVVKNIKAQHVILEEKDNLHIEDGREGSVVGVYSSGRITFENCELVGCGIYGIFTENTEEVRINGCYIHHNSLNALYFSNRLGTTNVYIKGSRIINNAGYAVKEGNINIFADESNTLENNTPEAYNTTRGLKK
ncbi:MAG: right-handed parallel beta-helix repeat-containing protein [Clostridia bacterium]|nr:right-handed parallel beta-helix repeat-containing protein [Clostridia bacterium]